jgi:hypothetical protein
VSFLSHAPDRIAHVVRDQERSVMGNCHTDRPAERFFVAVEKAGQDVDG